MKTELVLGPLIGGLSHQMVHLWGRANGPGILYAWIGRQPDLRDAILAGTSLALRGEDGFSGVAPVERLTPKTTYFYHLGLDHSFPQPGNGPLPDGKYPSFTTFPLPGERVPFNFAFGSCFRPKSPADGKIFYLLNTQVAEEELRFLIMLGDQVYADDYQFNSLGHPASSLEDYRQVYQHYWGHPGFRQALAQLPVYMTLDDHEVDDDWRWLDMDRQRAFIPWWDRLSRWLNKRPLSEIGITPGKVQHALQAYWEHQGMHAPALELPLELNQVGQYALKAADSGSLAYSFNYGAAAFFVLDTRSMRSRMVWPFQQRSATMLGEGQWRAFEAWLLSVKDYPVKFIVSSSALLFNLWLDIPRDRWSGYKKDRQRMFSLLAEEGGEGLVILTGDLHSSHSVRGELLHSDGQRIPLWEFCSSPFDQQTNKYAHLLRQSTNLSPYRTVDCPFILAENNYGRIRVNYEPAGDPHVVYEVVGETGEVLAKTGF
jgi:alkaline phosphatase D